jgi:hypothetical protein
MTAWIPGSLANIDRLATVRLGPQEGALRTSTTSPPSASDRKKIRVAVESMASTAVTSSRVQQATRTSVQAAGPCRDTRKEASGGSAGALRWVELDPWPDNQLARCSAQWHAIHSTCESRRRVCS